VNIENKTNILLGEKLSTDFDSKKLVDWAVDLLQNNYDTESLCILAGLDHESTEVREKYFQESLKELKIEINKTDSELIDEYIIHIAKEVINDRIDPVKAVSIIYNIVVYKDYFSDYNEFFDLSEDLLNLEYDGRTIFNFGLTNSNKEKYIKEEFSLLLKFKELGVDQDIRIKYICDRCKKIIETKQKRVFPFIKKRYFPVLVCKQCGSKEIYQIRSREGKVLYLKSLESNK